MFAFTAEALSYHFLQASSTSTPTESREIHSKKAFWDAAQITLSVQTSALAIKLIPRTFFLSSIYESRSAIYGQSEAVVREISKMQERHVFSDEGNTCSSSEQNS